MRIIYDYFKRLFQVFSYLFFICVILFFVFSNYCLAQTDAVRGRELAKLHERFWQVLIDSPRRGVTFDRIYEFYDVSNEVEKLIDKSLELTRRFPDDGRYWLLLGLIYERCGDTAKSIDAYGRAVKFSTSDPLAFYYFGEMLIKCGELSEGLKMLEIAVQNQPASKKELRSILLAIGKCAGRLGDSKKAAAAWNQLEQLYPNNAEIITTITNILENEGQIDEAIKRYEKFLKSQNNGYAFVRLKLSMIGLKIRNDKNFSPVDDYAELLDKLDSESWLAEIVRKRMELYFSERDNLTPLAEFYQNRLKKRPNEIATILQLTNLLIKLDRKNEALETLEISVTKNPNEILLRRALIDVYVTKNQLDDALAQYQKIDAIKPAANAANAAEYLTAWGELILKTNRPDKRAEAIKIWERMIKLSPKEPQVAIRVAELAARYDIIDAAEKYYKYAVELRPDAAEFREYLAIFYYRQSEIKKAIATIQSIAENKNKNAISLTRAGDLLQSIHADKEALDAFENAVKLAPRDVAIRWKYIECLTKNGAIDDVISQLIETDKLIQTDDEFDIFLRNETRFMLQRAQIENILKKLSNKISNNITQLDATKNQLRRNYWRLAVYNQYAGKIETAIKIMDETIDYEKNINNNNNSNITQITELLSLQILSAAAELYGKCNATDKAIKILQILATQDNARKTIFSRRLAELQIKNGNANEATQTIKQLLETGTSDASVIAPCAELLFKTGQIKDAIDLLRKSLRSNNKNLLIQQTLAEYLAEDGQFTEAINLLKQLFAKTQNVEDKMQLTKKLTEYFLSLETLDKNNVKEKKTVKLSGDKINEILDTVKNQTDKRATVLCVAVAYEVLSDFAAMRSELEGFLIETGGGLQNNRRKDDLLLRKLVVATENLHDYESAVRYQELICKDNNNSSELDKLFALYDVNGNREKISQLFMRQILNKTDIKEQINMIDRMICREEYEAVDHVLSFFEIHEESNWEIMYRQVAVAAYRKQKNLSELARNFRMQNFAVIKIANDSDDNNNNNNININNKRNEYSTDEQLTKYLDDQFNNNAWKLSGKFPTTDFSIWGNDDLTMLEIFRRQEVFLLTLRRENLLRNMNYRTFNNVPPPKPFYKVDDLAEAKFIVLGWLLREEKIEKIINDHNPTTKEIKRLKALANSLNKN
ncbi:MAG: tetratricopeptide repeat protein [Planctomycetaceae bacterium]|jgi:tetratricopeptide (TPR) repeat protein|nr:tetratricopeptide repeat protein [Planctomycetaceae bacterium]